MSLIYKEYSNFLTPEECSGLINYFTDPNRAAQGKMVLRRAEVDDNVNGGSKQDPSRKAELLFFKRNGDIAEKYALTKKLMGHLNSGDFGDHAFFTFKNLEGWQFIKYDVGGEYIPHFDFDSNLDNRHNKIRLANAGGLRLKSIIIYLNEDFEGGETAFTKLNLKIKPETGKLLIWENVHPNRKLNTDTIHAGLPVIKGTKYVLITWLRETPFG